MDDELPEDNITKARDILRRNPNVTVEELKSALNLPNKAVASEIRKSAVQAEQDLKQKLGAEDAAAEAMGDKSEQKVYVRCRQTGHSFIARLVSETAKRVVLELEDESVIIQR